MVSELRGAVLLFVAFALFLIITGMLVLGSVMRPGRWSERPRVAALQDHAHAIINCAASVGHNTVRCPTSYGFTRLRCPIKLFSRQSSISPRFLIESPR